MSFCDILCSTLGRDPANDKRQRHKTLLKCISHTNQNHLHKNLQCLNSDLKTTFTEAFICLALDFKLQTDLMLNIENLLGNLSFSPRHPWRRSPSKAHYEHYDDEEWKMAPSWCPLFHFPAGTEMSAKEEIGPLRERQGKTSFWASGIDKTDKDNLAALLWRHKTQKLSFLWKIFLN